MGAQGARIQTVSSARSLQRLFAMHAVLALSMALLRMLGASDELTTDKGLPLGSSDMGRGLALVLLLGCVVALVLVARDSWSTRRSWPSWMLGALLLWSLWNTQGMHGPDILYLGAALCAFAASRALPRPEQA